MIIKFDKATLGKNKKQGQPVSRTITHIKCDGEDCNKEWTTAWSNKKRRKNQPDYCLSCQNKLCIKGMKGKKHSRNTLLRLKTIAQKNVGKKNPAKRPEVRKKISEKRKICGSPWLIGKKRPLHAAHMKQFMLRVMDESNGFRNDYRAKLLSSQHKRKSKLHKRVKAWLVELGILFSYVLLCYCL